MFFFSSPRHGYCNNTQPARRLFRAAFFALLGAIVAIAGSCVLSNTARLHWQAIGHELAPHASLPHPLENGLAIAGLCWVAAVATMKLSPKPRTWSKVIIVSLLLSLFLRYLIWRSLFTLNLDSLAASLFSLALLGMETWILLSYSVQLFLMLREGDRRREARTHAEAVASGTYQPRVDILIPSYDEPADILRRTLVGCQALDYPHKTVYLLDDTRRPHIRQLAADLGCEYLTRPDNRHAKAGNLNHALTRTDSELVLFFDADFVPTRDFLLKTVGFFQDPDMGMVQTHQCFYNADLVSRNLGLDGVFPHEVEVFSRHYQKLRDGANSSLCYGSAFIARRSALADVGNFVTDTLGEDYFTGIRLSASGYRVIYLDENLSAGLAAETITGHIAQRQRWVRGTLQSFFVSHNPLTLPGLTFRQRLAHAEGILQWFNSLWQVGFLLVPLVYYYLGVLPIRTTAEDWLAYFLPYYLVNVATYAWLNYRSRSALISAVYSLVTSVPISLSIVQTLVSPFSQGFNVTPKGVARDRFVFNLRLALPLVVVAVLTVLGLSGNAIAWWELRQAIAQADPVALSRLAENPADNLHNATLGLLWGVFNLIWITLAILSFIDAPTADSAPAFALRRQVWLGDGTTACWGTTLRLSEAEAVVQLPDGSANRHLWQAGDRLKLAIELDAPPSSRTPSHQAATPDRTPHPKHLHLSGAIVATPDDTCLTLRFDPLSVSQHRQLIELLFCRPGQWEAQETPGEWRSLAYLLKALVLPPILTRRPRA